MTMTEPGSRSRPMRGLVRALAVVMAAAFGVIGLAVTPAAAQVCGGVRANTCLDIVHLGNRVYAVHIGIEVPMSRQDAQAIIDAPGDPFVAQVWGFDNNDSDHDFRFTVPMTAIGAGDNALGADFDTVVAWSLLDEDEGGDELFARVTLTDPRTGLVRTFDSPQFHGRF